MESASPPLPTTTAASRYRYVLLLALVTLAAYAACWRYPNILATAGVGTGGVWFRDTEAVLSAIDVYRQGLNPYSETTRHYYSHWWFALSATGLTPRDSLWVGGLVSGLGLVAGWWVARPRTAGEVGWALGVLCSAPVLLGLNRGNVDLLLFALLCLGVPLLTSPVRFWRIAGAPLVIALGMGLKYYPVLAAPVLLGVRPARDRRLAYATMATVFAMTFLSIAPDLVGFGGVVDHLGFYVFGAPAFFAKVGLPARAGFAATLLLLLAAGLAWYRHTALRTWTVPAALRSEYLNFILGASILTGCFILTSNYAYRWIFALLLLAFLGRLDSLPLEPTVRRLKQLTRVLLMIQLWVEPLIIADLNLRPRTLEGLILWERTSTLALTGVTWLLFACLAAWLVHFAFTQLRAAAEPQPD